jgi:hypothetical protein
MTIAPFDPQSIKQDRAVLSRSATRTAWFVGFVLVFLLLPSARMNGQKPPIWFTLPLRILAVVDAGFIYRRVSGQAPDERKLTVRVETYDQLEAQKWAALAFMTSQNIKRSVLPPPPTREQIAAQSQPRQIAAAPQQEQSAIAVAQPATQHQPQAEPTSYQEPELPFPTEDLARTLALTTVDPKNSGSTIAACPPGTGKSNFVRAAIKAAHDLHQGKADIYVFAGKDDETYCGLEKDSNRYIYSADHELAPIVYSRMYALRPRLRKAPGYATINILEESNNTIQATQLYDKFNKKNKKAIPVETLLEAAIYEQVTKGRSKLFVDWITTHSANKEDINLNGAIKRACNFAVMGRGNKYGALSDALQGRNAIVDDELIRRRLYDEFLEYLNGPKFNPDRVLALTNILGRWRLVFLPRYPDNQPEIQCLIPAEQFSDRPVDITNEDDGEEDTDPYAYRYTEGHEHNAALAMTMTQGQCCYPGCTEPATEAHHICYQEDGESICDNPQPGKHLYPLCDDHHQDRKNPECAHHRTNWIKGSCPHPLQIDSRNTDQYILLLKQGWLEKTSQRIAA